MCQQLVYNNLFQDMQDNYAPEEICIMGNGFRMFCQHTITHLYNDTIHVNRCALAILLTSLPLWLSWFNIWWRKSFAGVHLFAVIVGLRNGVIMWRQDILNLTKSTDWSSQDQVWWQSFLHMWPKVMEWAVPWN